MNLFDTDRTSLEDACRARRASYSVDQHTECARALGMFSLLCDKRDLSFTPCIVNDGFWQIWLHMALAKLVTPGMICVDVGANVGFFTLAMAEMVGKQGHVYAFEPLQRQGYLLGRSVAMNGFGDRASVYRTACGDVKRDANIFYTMDNKTSASLLPADLGSVKEMTGEIVYVNRLDDAIQDHVDLIKIDAEGMDYDVIRGASGLIDRNADTIIVFEHNLAGRSPEQASKMNCDLLRLVESDWSIELADFDGEIKPVNVNTILDTPERSWDLVARKR